LLLLLFSEVVLNQSVLLLFGTIRNRNIQDP
jgi:hypothetical protein